MQRRRPNRISHCAGVVRDGCPNAGGDARRRTEQGGHSVGTAGVEFGLAVRRFDHARPRETEARLRQQTQMSAGRGEHRRAAECRAGDDGQGRNSHLAHGEQCLQRPRQRQFRGVGLVQAHAPRIDQQHDRLGTLVECALQHPLQGHTMIRADAAAQEARVLRHGQHAQRIDLDTCANDAVTGHCGDSPAREVRTAGGRRQWRDDAAVRECGEACRWVECREERHA